MSFRPPPPLPYPPHMMRPRWPRGGGGGARPPFPRGGGGPPPRMRMMGPPGAMMRGGRGFGGGRPPMRGMRPPMGMGPRPPMGMGMGMGMGGPRGPWPPMRGGPRPPMRGGGQRPNGPIAGVKRPASDSSSSIPGSEKLDFLEAWINSYSTTLPQTLVDKCKPLHCELCSVQMNSSQQAQMHYDGKLHDKRTRLFLQNWSRENNSAAPQKKSPMSSPAKVARVAAAETKNQLQANDLYCKCCDLSFTSQIHAEQHYLGRNHARKSAGLGPLKTGYFNRTTGKWQRHPTGEEEEEDERGETNFTVIGEGNPVIGPPAVPMISPYPPLPQSDLSDNNGAAASATEAGRSKFFCEICKVGATSQQQLDMHLNGKAHKARESGTPLAPRKLKQTQPQTPTESETPQPTSAPTPTLQVPPLPSMPPPTPPPPASASATAAPASDPNLNKYRTPSGQFYCAKCNCSLNSESQFVQHTESKKHKMRHEPGFRGTGRMGGRANPGGPRGRGGGNPFT